MEKSPKTILLVDDDSVFLKGMLYTVKQLGYDVLLATGGKEAADIFTNSPVDAIISDINMPEGNGLQLLNYVKKRSSVPVILMTGLSDLKEAQKAIDMGATSFLSKPFKKAELASVLQSIFDNQEGDKKKSTKEVMVKLHVEEFLHGQSMNFDIFLKKGEELIKVSNGGERISPETIVTYRQTGITSLHVRKKDFVSYLGLSDFCSEIDKHKERKLKIKEAALQILGEINSLNRFNTEAISRATSLFFTFVEILTDNEKCISLFEMLLKDNHGLFKRGVYSSLLVTLIGQYSGSRSLRDTFSLAVASLFSDVGLIGTKTLEKRDALELLTAEEKALFEAHPVRGAKALSQIQHLPNEVFVIIRQHEEKEDGSGYPLGINGGELHPLSKLVGTVNAFVFEFYRTEAVNPENAITALEDFAVKSLKVHDIKTLEAMLQAFNLDIPHEFVEYQLNSVLSFERIV